MLSYLRLLLLLNVSLWVAFCQSFTYEAAGTIACPARAARNFSTTCASDCLHHPSCSGFTWNPSDRSCTLAFDMPVGSAGACVLYLRPGIKALRQRCANFTISLPSSPDRLFALLPRKELVARYESSCRAIGGDPADLHQGSSVSEMVQVLSSHHFQDPSMFRKCDSFSYKNVQCKISIGGTRLNSTFFLWADSGAALDLTVFDVVMQKTCGVPMTVSIQMTGDRSYVRVILKCDGPHLRFPLCQCKPR